MTAKHNQKILIVLAVALFSLTLLFIASNGSLFIVFSHQKGTLSLVATAYDEEGVAHDIPISVANPFVPQQITLQNQGQTLTLSKLAVTTSGTLSNLQSSAAWNSTATQHFEVYQNGKVIVLNGQPVSSTATYYNGGAIWGNPETLSNIVIDNKDLDPILAVYGNGIYTIQVSGTIQLSGVFNGQQQTLSASYAGILTVTETSSAVMLSVAVTYTPMQVISP